MWGNCGGDGCLGFSTYTLFGAKASPIYWAEINKKGAGEDIEDFLARIEVEIRGLIED